MRGSEDARVGVYESGGLEKIYKYLPTPQRNR